MQSSLRRDKVIWKGFDRTVERIIIIEKETKMKDESYYSISPTEMMLESAKSDSL